MGKWVSSPSKNPSRYWRNGTTNRYISSRSSSGNSDPGFWGALGFAAKGSRVERNFMTQRKARAQIRSGKWVATAGTLSTLANWFVK